MKPFITILAFSLFFAHQSVAQTEPTQTTTALKAETKQPDVAQAKVESKPAAKQQEKDATAEPAKTLDLTFDDLKFEMEKGTKFSRTMLTAEIRKYHNSVITLRGYMKPHAKQSGLKKFVFVRDNKECCFGPGAALYDCVLVQLAKETTAEFTVRPVTVTGKFYVKEYRIAGKVWAVFRMKNTSVK